MQRYGYFLNIQTFFKKKYNNAWQLYNWFYNQCFLCRHSGSGERKDELMAGQIKKADAMQWSAFRYKMMGFSIA